jgi:hypothetical protein
MQLKDLDEEESKSYGSTPRTLDLRAFSAVILVLVLLRIRPPAVLAQAWRTHVAFLHLAALLGLFCSLDLLSSFSYTLMIRS